MFRFGVVGCGHISQTAHLPSLRSIPEAKIVVVCDVREDIAKVIAERHKCEWTTDQNKVFERQDLDAVSILTPQTTHASLSIDALKCGKHVLLEKPMAMSSKEAKTMVETAKKHGLKLMVAHMKRYDSGVVKAKEVIEAGMIGEPVFGRFHQFGGEWVANRHIDVGTYGTYMDASYVPQKEPKGDVQVNKREAFMSSWLNQYSHDTNYMRFFLGDPSAVEITSSYKEKIYGNWLSMFGVTLFSWDNELEATLEFGEVSAKFWNEECQVYGDRGFLDLKHPVLRLWNQPAELTVYTTKVEEFGADWLRYMPDWTTSYRNQYLHFLECLEKDLTPRTSGEDTVKDLILAEVAYKSLESKKPVRINYSI